VDLTIKQLDIRVSLLWLLEGKGIVEEAELKGVRGTLDRSTSWDQYDENGELIPRELHVLVPPEDRWRAKWYRGSFHLAKCVVSDAIISLKQPLLDRDLEIIVHSFNSKRLRRQWLAMDVLCSTMDGSFDGRLFSLRKADEQTSPRHDIMVKKPIWMCSCGFGVFFKNNCFNSACTWTVQMWILFVVEQRVH
jgi:distribution and morphology protein 31